MFDGMMGIGMAVCLLVGLGLLVLLVLGIVWLVRHAQAPRLAGGRTPSESGARHELEMRYARGEIDRETYLVMRDDLGRR